MSRTRRASQTGAKRGKVKLARTSSQITARPILITGGAGFIGSNLADALMSRGKDVILFDNLSRPGVSANLDWLQSRHGSRAVARKADLRDESALIEAVGDAGAVFHLAAQVAVTESLVSPVEDFAINAGGTLHVLEALRLKKATTPLVFASTNKVYGGLHGLELTETADSYQPANPLVRVWGIDESQPLDFCTPYGCSKGAADQYVIDYANSFGLPAVVLRMSCVYGPRQFGTEDQGWVAHFLIRALKGEPITLFGDGRQVRDILHVSDAIRAYQSVLDDVERLSGKAFNLGGGADNAVSLIMVLDEMERLLGRPVDRVFQPTRTGDQLYFVADTRRLAVATGWRAQIPWKKGLQDLLDWLETSGIGAGSPAEKEQWSLTA